MKRWHPPRRRRPRGLNGWRGGHHYSGGGRTRIARVALAGGLLATALVPTETIPSAADIKAAGAAPDAQVPERCEGAVLEDTDSGAPPQVAGRTPVVMIHGLNGSAVDWRRPMAHTRMPYSSLVGSGRTLAGMVGDLPGVALYTFDYRQHARQWIDHEGIGGAFGEAIDCLSSRFGRQVVVVAHSMGGLATRWVANTTATDGTPRAERIGHVVTIGTPSEGSQILALVRAVLEGGSALGAVQGNPLLPAVRGLVAACGRSSGSCPLPLVDIPYSEAGRALAPGSKQLAELEPWPEVVQVHAIAGQILLTSEYGLFFSPPAQTVDWGDVYVAADSAVADADTQRVFPCRHTPRAYYEGFLGDMGLVESSGGLDLPAHQAYWFVASPCYHRNLLNMVEVAGEVLGSLNDWLKEQEGLLAGGDIIERQVTEGAATMFVVDTSGSMDEYDDNGVRKIDAAKSNLLDYLEQVEPGTTLGLRTYPGGSSSSSSSCSTGDLRFSPAARDPAGMAALIRGLAPDGDTPTADALRAAADDLRAVGLSQATIVLLSDGESNCGDDPCVAAGEISQSGIEVTIMAVAFQLSGAGAQELQCIADATGGSYFDADNAEDLAEVLSDLSVPQLELSLAHPQSTVADVGDSGVVEVTGTVSNVSQMDATGVRARLRIDEGSSPGLAAPDQALGNLAPGQQVTATWRFRPSVSAVGSTLRFTVVTRAANGADVDASGQIAITDGASRDHAGPLLREADRVAIMGDSYSSGEGAGDYLAGTDRVGRNMCHRSRNSYLVEALDIPDELILACSGALAQHMGSPQWSNNQPAQVAQLQEQQQADGPVDAVVLTLGGNDASFSTLALACLRPARVSCSRTIALRSAHTWVEQRLGRPGELGPVGHNLRDAYLAINQELNNATRRDDRGGWAPIVVLSYPRIISQGRVACDGVGELTDSEMSFINEFITLLNGKVEAAVEAARRVGIPAVFVPETEQVMQPANTICDGDRAYAQRPPSLLSYVGMSPSARQEPLHPNADGYRAMSQAIIRWSNTDSASAMVDWSPPEPEPLRIPAGMPVSTALAGSSPRAATVLQPAADGSAATVNPGRPLEVSVDGFAPDLPVEVTVRSDLRTIGEAHAEEDGKVVATVSLPHDIDAGRHTIVVSGYDPNGTPHAVRIPIQVPKSRSWLLLAVVVLSVLCLCAALLLRRKARKPLTPPDART